MLTQIKPYLKKTKEYAKSTNKFWDDEHISKGMLESHLNQDSNLATRKEEFVDASVDWIESVCSADKYKRLLDLGCGPGIYAEKFYHKGYEVTGMDFSARSVEYAKMSAEKKNMDIVYKYKNYLEMDFENSFDLVTMIWCDYGVLSPEDRGELLLNIYKALRVGGKFIFDVFNKNVFDNKIEGRSFEYSEGGGFWSGKDYLLLNTVYKYDNRIVNNQNIVVTDDTANCYNIWEHYFDLNELKQEVEKIGFKNIQVYGDIAGGEYAGESETICLVVEK